MLGSAAFMFGVLGCGSSASDAALSPSAGGSASAGSSAQAGAAGSSVGVSGAAGSAATPGAGASAVAGASGSIGAGGSGGTSAPVYTGPGFAPTNVSKSDAQAAYDAWKAGHLEDCTGGVWRVRWETNRQDATVSEGIGYGALLTVSYGDRSAFDGLIAYAKLMHDSNGLMNWLRYGCDAHRETKDNSSPDNSASDADLDLAMALLMAQCKWGDAQYGDRATEVINAIRTKMFMDVNGLHVLLPGDSTWFNGMGGGCINYSYLAPAYFRAFAKHVSADATSGTRPPTTRTSCSAKRRTRAPG